MKPEGKVRIEKKIREAFSSDFATYLQWRKCISVDINELDDILWGIT